MSTWNLEEERRKWENQEGKGGRERSLEKPASKSEFPGVCDKEGLRVSHIHNSFFFSLPSLDHTLLFCQKRV
jgi:hypothetical protein